MENVENNEICCMEEIRKVNWPNFSQVSLCKKFISQENNRINEFRSFSCFSGRKLWILLIELKENNIEQCSDMSYFAKVGLENLKTLST